MENVGRRKLLQMFFTAGAVAAIGVVASKAEAAGALLDTAAAPVATDAAATSVTEAVEAGLEPTQAIVIRPGRRRGPRVIVRPRRRRRICRRNWRGRLVCRVW